MKYLDVMARGGIMMWPILACLLVALGVVVDRIVAFRRVDWNPTRFLTALRNLIRRRDESGMAALCGDRLTPLAVILREVLSQRSGDPGSIWRTVDYLCRAENFQLERRLPLLWLSALSAPLLGMFGTIIGMISVLKAVEIHPVLAGTGMLAGHLWAALLPMLFGLGVGIPALAVHIYLTARARAAAHTLEGASRQVVELLSGTPVPAEVVRPAPVVEQPSHRLRSHDDDEFFRRKPEARVK